MRESSQLPKRLSARSITKLGQSSTFITVFMNGVAALNESAISPSREQTPFLNIELKQTLALRKKGNKT